MVLKENVIRYETVCNSYLDFNGTCVAQSLAFSLAFCGPLFFFITSLDTYSCLRLIYHHIFTNASVFSISKINCSSYLYIIINDSSFSILKWIIQQCSLGLLYRYYCDGMVTYCDFKAAMASRTPFWLYCDIYLYISGRVSRRFSSVLPLGTVANLNGRGLCL